MRRQPSNIFKSDPEVCVFLIGCEWTFPSVHPRFAWTHDRGDDGRPDVFADLHLQQQLHPLHHGHLEEAPASGLGEGAAPGGQVNALAGGVEGGGWADGHRHPPSLPGS